MTQFSDASLDQMAHRYALQHRMSYAEALDKVVTITQEGGAPPATAATTQSAAPASPHAPTDAQIDQAAQRLARERGLDYISAFNMVIAHLKQHPAQSQAMAATDADQRLHAAAMNYAQSRHVSYAEALSQVSATFSTANFSEASPEAVDAVRALESQEIEIFRAGSHVSSDGQSITFRPADVQAMAASYSPGLLVAPLTLGHPEDNQPGYGKVQSLRATPDGRLFMRVKDVSAQLAQAIKQGFFKKRSASFLPPNAPSNPTPGKWYLRHVGWLGAEQPAINGLADVSFAQSCNAEAMFLTRI